MLEKWLRDGVAVDACVRMFVHWAWGDRAQSRRAIDCVREGLDACAKPAHCEPYLQLLHALLDIGDSLRWWRVEHCMAAFVRAVDAQNGRRPMLARLCEWLIVAVGQWRAVRRWCAQHTELLNDVLVESGFTVKA
jgi:hypothetical protein